MKEKSIIESSDCLADGTRAELILSEFGPSSKSADSNNRNIVIGYTAEEIEQWYSTGNIGHFHCNFSDTEGVSPSPVEIGRKTGDVSQSPLEKRELAGGENLVS